MKIHVAFDGSLSMFMRKHLGGWLVLPVYNILDCNRGLSIER